MNKTELLNRVDFLINLSKELIEGQHRTGYTDYVDSGKQAGYRAASLSFIKTLYGESHIYYKDFEIHVNGNRVLSIQKGLSILNSIRHEINNDWLISMKLLISAEIFSDFLEMSRHLLDTKYKDAAAVMIGSVLEEHLRQLCKNHSVDITITKGTDIIPKKTDVLNADLVKAGVYNIMMQKNITAWLDIRNNAAHGHYDQYKIENVELMYQGVLNFISTAN